MEDLLELELTSPLDFLVKNGVREFWHWLTQYDWSLGCIWVKTLQIYIREINVALISEDKTDCLKKY